MGITHVIRGDDHLTNRLPQTQIYRALDGPGPEFPCPLITAATAPNCRSGTARSPSTPIATWLPAGGAAQLPAAARLGARDDEIISTEQAIQWFTSTPSPTARRASISSSSTASTDTISANAGPAAGRADPAAASRRCSASDRRRRRRAACSRHAGLKTRAKTLVELARMPGSTSRAGARRQARWSRGGRPLIAEIVGELSAPEALATEWSAAALESGCGSWPKPRRQTRAVANAARRASPAPGVAGRVRVMVRSARRTADRLRAATETPTPNDKCRRTAYVRYSTVRRSENHKDGHHGRQNSRSNRETATLTDNTTGARGSCRIMKRVDRSQGYRRPQLYADTGYYHRMIRATPSTGQLPVGDSTYKNRWPTRGCVLVSEAAVPIEELTENSDFSEVSYPAAVRRCCRPPEPKKKNVG